MTPQVTIQTQQASAWKPHEWAQPDDRDELMIILDAAYREVMDEKWERLGMWDFAMHSIRDAFQETLARHGYESAPLYFDDFLERLGPIAPIDQVQHMRLVRACFTDCTQRVQQHINYRVDNEGNVLVVFQGVTGSGKSSAAIGLADWMSRIPRGELRKYVNYDRSDLAARLKNKKAGELVVQDEMPQTAGQGARTEAMFWENILDQLRASGVSVAVCTPGGYEHSTVQIVFDAVAWNKKTKHTLFLVWVNGKPIGLTAMPWMAEDLYEPEYKPWKKENLDRVLSGLFRDNTWYARTAVRFFRDPRVVRFLVEAKEKPKKPDIKAALMVYNATMMSGDQSDTLIDWIFTVVTGWDRLGPHFKEDFGIEPSAGLVAVGEKCTKL